MTHSDFWQALALEYIKVAARRTPDMAGVSVRPDDVTLAVDAIVEHHARKYDSSAHQKDDQSAPKMGRPPKHT